MRVELKIANSGEAMGTVGWLAKAAGSIHICCSTEGKRIAILRDKEGARICFLTKWQTEGEEYPGAPAGYWRLRNLNNCEYYATTDSKGRYAGLTFTPAAWVSMQAIMDAAERLLDAERDYEIPATVSVAVGLVFADASQTKSR